MPELLESKEFIIKLPQHTNFEIRVFTEFLRTLSKIFKNIPFAMSLNMINKRIFFTVKVPAKYQSVMENQLYAVFPKIELEEIARTFDPQNAEVAAQADLRLRYGDHYPFQTYESLEGSFLSDIYNQFNRLTAQEKFFMQLKIKPLDQDKAIFTMKRSIDLNVKNFKQRLNIVEGFFSKKASPEIRARGMAAAQEKNRQALFHTEIDILLFSESYELAAAKLEPIAQVFQKLESEYNEFKYRIKPVNASDLDRISSVDIPASAFHMSAEEVSTISSSTASASSISASLSASAAASSCVISTLASATASFAVANSFTDTYPLRPYSVVSCSDKGLRKRYSLQHDQCPA